MFLKKKKSWLDEYEESLFKIPKDLLADKKLIILDNKGFLCNSMEFDEDGLLHGTEELYSDRVLKYSVQHKHGVRHGHRFHYIDGITYVFKYINGKLMWQKTLENKKGQPPRSKESP